MRPLALLVSFVVLWLSSLAAIKNDRFTATWDAPATPVDRYEFRWRHFASPDWIPLPDQPGTAATFTVTFPALPNTPTFDRWMCLDARSIKANVAWPWLSDTAAGPACALVDAGTIVITPPPVIPPPVELFSNVTNASGVLSFDYRPADCKRGVQQGTGPLKNGSRTITLTCRK